jgi:hypothetical protein
MSCGISLAEVRSMKISRSVRRIASLGGVEALLIAIAGVSAGCSTHVDIDDTSPLKVTVRYDDLNLHREAGVATLASER